MSERVVVAMSGGVDSAVAAALLHEQGYDVIGITLNVWPRDDRAARRACCGLTGIEDARRVASRLGIRHYVLNFRRIFERTVIQPFLAEYERGRTPNPCVRCNQLVKFGALLARARALDAHRVATGHYARIARAGGRWLLLRARARRNDQTYFLSGLTQHQLNRILFPLGELGKDDVRRMAAELGLTVAAKPASQEICFVPDDDYRAFLASRGRTSRPGPVLDTRGNRLGRHAGITGYTIGQRRGLGLAFGSRRYVVALDPRRAAVVLGDASDVYASALRARQMNYIAFPTIVDPVAVTARVRHAMDDVRAELEKVPGGAVLRFAEPQWAITPGQAVVCYQGEVVVGGGTIVGRL